MTASDHRAVLSLDLTIASHWLDNENGYLLVVPCFQFEVATQEIGGPTFVDSWKNIILIEIIAINVDDLS